MPQNEAAAIDPLAGGSFSRLLFSDVEIEDAANIAGLDDHHRRRHPDNTNGGGASHFTFGVDRQPPKMLCFGADYISGNINGVSAVSSTPQNSTTTTTDDNNNSSSPSSTTNSTTTSLSSNSNMKRNMHYQPIVLSSSFTTTGATTTPARSPSRNNKKMRAEKTPPTSHAKVKKEKLGERVAALQQIVSPYGKTDTASVLHEAMGYIKFLQEQVQVLCSPYLQRPPSIQTEGKDDGGGERRKDLGSRGLCLVPVEGTLHVAESNGADLWSPAMVNRHNSSVLR